MTKYFLPFIMCVASFAGGFLVHEFWFKPSPEIQWKTETKYNSISRDYGGMEKQECITALSCYDSGEMTIESTPTLDGMEIECKLCDREASREMKIDRSLPKWLVGGMVGVQARSLVALPEAFYGINVSRRVGSVYLGGGVILGSGVGVYAKVDVAL